MKFWVNFQSLTSLCQISGLISCMFMHMLNSGVDRMNE